jgi:hypothetical protein
VVIVGALTYFPALLVTVEHFQMLSSSLICQPLLFPQNASQMSNGKAHSFSGIRRTLSIRNSQAGDQGIIRSQPSVGGKIL